MESGAIYPPPPPPPTHETKSGIITCSIASSFFYGREVSFSKRKMKRRRKNKVCRFRGKSLLYLHCKRNLTSGNVLSGVWQN